MISNMFMEEKGINIITKKINTLYTKNNRNKTSIDLENPISTSKDVMNILEKNKILVQDTEKNTKIELKKILNRNNQI